MNSAGEYWRKKYWLLGAFVWLTVEHLAMSKHFALWRSMISFGQSLCQPITITAIGQFDKIPIAYIPTTHMHNDNGCIALYMYMYTLAFATWPNSNTTVFTRIFDRNTKEHDCYALYTTVLFLPSTLLLLSHVTPLSFDDVTSGTQCPYTSATRHW